MCVTVSVTVFLVFFLAREVKVEVRVGIIVRGPKLIVRLFGQTLNI